MAECQKGKAAYMTTFDITQTIFNFFAMLYLHHFMQAFSTMWRNENHAGYGACILHIRSSPLWYISG